MTRPKPLLERERLRGISGWSEEQYREWFYSNTKEDEEGCLIWQRPLGRKGYGNARWRGKTLGAHVVAFILAHGAVPTGLQVNHHCDKRSCVRSKCVYAGTPAQNSRDMVERGRWRGNKKQQAVR